MTPAIAAERRVPAAAGALHRGGDAAYSGDVKAPRMRPVFEVRLQTTPDTVAAALEAGLKEEGARVMGVVMPPIADLRVPDDRRHFFSPVLALRWEPSAENETTLQGRFSPQAHVWMLFMAIYLSLAFIAIGGAMYAIAQYILEQAPWAALIVPLALGMAAFVYGAAFIGQGLGGDQMYRLRTFVDRQLGEHKVTVSKEPAASS